MGVPYLIQGSGDRSVNNVTDSAELGLPGNFGFLGLCNQLLLGLGQLVLISHQFSRVFLSLELLANLLLNFVDLLIYLIAFELDCQMRLDTINLDNLSSVDDGFSSKDVTY